ncbi:MAG TPA: glycosyltransferase family 1 protein [Arcobacter sp.]|nr:glycosyltransferase family 1 protein [Arcobacter sp.]
MKVHILYPFVDGPWGGANQFLKAIREYFIEQGCYEEELENADVILFNSSPNSLVALLPQIYRLKQKFPNKLFVNRIDGPVFYIRDRNRYIDKAFYLFNESVCEGTIFQSNWSREKNYHLGMKKNRFEVTVLNAPNPNIFNINHKKPFAFNRKIKLIATSWSNNLKKGFDVYKWMDEHLDFSKYEMVFIGNSPYDFQNIEIKEPMKSSDLAMALQDSDIIITASQSDPCSNALIEAIHCGLPAIGLDDGGHTEIIGRGGEVFREVQEIPQLLEKISMDYEAYQKNIELPNIHTVGKLYLDFCHKISMEIQKSKYFTFISYLKIKAYIFIWRVNEKMYAFKNRFLK